ncbi:dihydrofolate reductase [Listeria costaricensis]|uniref:dihydrofolate reductase n=1 Tax=Listeria costaricensis TaxID=2026604 RepID=UPI000C06B95F|nr:dihydrofolate reductase [Listeria costaricensis]
MLTFIWAQDEQGAIGKDNRMPWHLPADLRFFKEQTTGKTIVMGRKTYESLGKALPNRENLVLSRSRDLRLSDAEVVHEVEPILARAKTEDIFICGGAEIYRLFMPYVDRLIVTKIAATFSADTKFPEVDWSKFTETSRMENKKDEKNPYDYTFVTYVRKKPNQ